MDFDYGYAKRRLHELDASAVMKEKKNSLEWGWCPEPREERDGELWRMDYNNERIGKMPFNEVHRFEVINWLEDNGYNVKYFSSERFLIIDEVKIISLVTRKWRNKGYNKWYWPNFKTIAEFCNKYID